MLRSRLGRILTTGSVIIGGRVKAHVCVDAGGNITLVPSTKATFA